MGAVVRGGVRAMTTTFRTKARTTLFRKSAVDIESINKRAISSSQGADNFEDNSLDKAGMIGGQNG